MVAVKIRAHESGPPLAHSDRTYTGLHTLGLGPGIIQTLLFPEEAFSLETEMCGIARSWEGERSEIKSCLGSNNIDVTTLTQVHPLISLCFS